MWYWPFAAPNRTLILPWQLCGGLLEGKDGLFFSEFPTLCPQYYFNTHWSWSLAPLTTSSCSVTLPSLMKRPTDLQPLVWVIYPKRELPILIDGLFCLPWKRNRRKKVFSDFSFFWRVSNNFLLCWKARLPLSTGYWIYSLPGWWNSRNFGKGSHANCLFTSIVIWLQSWAGFVFSQVTSEQLVTELNSYKMDAGSCLKQSSADSARGRSLPSLSQLGHWSVYLWAPAHSLLSEPRPRPSVQPQPWLAASRLSEPVIAWVSGIPGWTQAMLMFPES